jgi:Zn-dependent M16 (insulinase) family peptidase
MESGVIHNGHRLAMSLAARNFSAASALNEAWHGISQLQTIKALCTDTGTAQLEKLSGNLEKIAETIFCKNNLKIAIIGEQQDIDKARPLSEEICKKLGTSENCGFGSPDFKPDANLPREGWSTATAVSFVAKVMETKSLDHKDAPALAVISKLLKSMFLHREIREKGGAYGGFSLYQLENGQFYFGSYRDPHIVRTLKVYDSAADFITSGDYDQENIEEAILQVCSEIDRPDPPGPAATKAFYRRIIGLSDELRKNFKQGVLQVDLQQVRETALKYFKKPDEKAAVAVISSQDQLTAANEELEAKPLSVYRI